MKTKILSLVSGDGMKARAIRGTALSVAGFGGSQFIRLVSNLILTRILFPEAFGLMALVQVFLVGLDNFSDLGIGPGIIQSKRGGDPRFLNTAWTIQILRGGILWLIACALAVPISQFYGQSALIQIIPVLAFTTILTGFSSTRIYLANRNLTLGRLTFVDLSSQLLGTVIMILMALWLRSVWALVIGAIAISLARTVLSHILIPGPKNKILWDKPAFWEIFHFGKYIFFGTIAGFFIQQGDRLILGKFIRLDELAIFSIAQMLATLPLMMSYHLVDRVLLPLYRNRPPAESDKNWRQIGRARGLMIIGLLGLTTLFALGGDFTITFLYDERYHLAGPLLVLLSISVAPRIITGGYSFILIANGNSRDYTILTSGTAILKIGVFILAIKSYGLVGAVLASVLVDIIIYPFQVYYIRRYRGWHPLHDLGFMALIILISGLALWNSPAALDMILEVLPR